MRLSAPHCARTRKISAAFVKRAGEKTLSYEEFLAKLKADGTMN